MIAKTTLGRICNISSAGDKPIVFEEVKSDRCSIPVIANGIENEGIIGYTNIAKVETEAVTVSARGNIGTAFYRNTPYYPVIRLLTITPKNYFDIDCRYLYYLLKNSSLKGIGSVQAQLTVPDVSEMEIFYEEDYATQKRISDILSSIDLMIENNTSICFDIESMAKLLYDYWFVQFDFPDENEKPYKTSSGKMVWNEQLKREIPEGWSVSKLGRECDVLLGGTPDTNQIEYWDGGIPWLNSGEVANSPVLSSEKTITIMAPMSRPVTKN